MAELVVIYRCLHPKCGVEFLSFDDAKNHCQPDVVERYACHNCRDAYSTIDGALTCCIPFASKEYLCTKCCSTYYTEDAADVCCCEELGLCNL